jgi:2-polyprenyl-3-methyl-5-hydroxy-6-metoxy-1,4-benzoquinol methylase
MSSELVREYYTGQVRKEWRRLVRDPYHRLELDTSLRFLKKYLPPGGLVLDAGGGPGRYTLELARRGYTVELFDMTPANLAFARRMVKRYKIQDRVIGIHEGTITDLSRFADESFEAVICLGGPLSHILDPGQRAQALGELQRVAKPGAPLFISVMSRLSVLVVELTLFPEELALPHYPRLRDSGDYGGEYGFTACHFFLPEELRAACEQQGLQVHEMAGLEGISSNQRKALNRLARQPELFSTWLDTHNQTCTHPSIVGISEHMLVVGVKGTQAHSPKSQRPLPSASV